MKQHKLPVGTLPAWAKLNDVSFVDVAVKPIVRFNEIQDHGLFTTRSLQSRDTFDVPTLMHIPHDLVLSAETIQEHVKVDLHLKELLDVAGGISLRHDIMLFLLMQTTIASTGHGHSVGVSGPWTEYVKVRPDNVPVPTMWSELDKLLLSGTSLESAVAAKVAALEREFDDLREKTSDVLWCKKCWWDEEVLYIADWMLLDAWYRSRSLELPMSGEAMVPCLDMINHATEANAYYEQMSTMDVSLILRSGISLDNEAEVTISYGAKSKAEMLFTYGFIDDFSSAPNSMVLCLDPMSDDPLAKAKKFAYNGQHVVRLAMVGEKLIWRSPFLYFIVLNEEDGLDFRVLQQTDGLQSPLKVFWQGDDVTHTTEAFESHISEHPLENVFRLRAVALLHDRFQQQLQRLGEAMEAVKNGQSLGALEHRDAALDLGTTEFTMLQLGLRVVEEQKNKLQQSDAVLKYLDSVQKRASPEEQAQSISMEETEISEPEDFS